MMITGMDLYDKNGSTVLSGVLNRGVVEVSIFGTILKRHRNHGNETVRRHIEVETRHIDVS